VLATARERKHLSFNTIFSKHTQWWVCLSLLTLIVAHHLFRQPLAVDLLNPSLESQRKQHKLKCLVQQPKSCFLDVKCPGELILLLFCLSLTHVLITGCLNVNVIFSNPSTVIHCSSCSTILCQPTGGKGRLTEGAIVTHSNDL